MRSIWSSPNNVLYGRGVALQAGLELKKLGCKKIMVIFDKGIKAAGIVDKILKTVEDEGIEYVCYDRVQPDPPDYSMDEAGIMAREAGVDGILAIGGGSSIDTGKGVCLLLSNEPPISRYFAHPGTPSQGDLTNLKPLVVIPTTAGTGSEVTPGGAVTDTKNHVKENFGCPSTLGLIDPELTIGLSPLNTAITAFDALGHAMESLVSRAHNKLSELYGVDAIRRIASYLPRAVRDGSDMEARENLHLAATMASMAMMGPYCHLPHDAGLTLGAIHNLPHGISSSCTLAEDLAFIAPLTPDRVRLAAQSLGAQVPEDATFEQIGDIACERVYKLMEDSRLPRLQDYIAKKEDLLASVPRVMETQNFFFSPRPVTAQDLYGILERAWDRRA